MVFPCTFFPTFLFKKKTIQHTNASLWLQYAFYTYTNRTTFVFKASRKKNKNHPYFFLAAFYSFYLLGIVYVCKCRPRKVNGLDVELLVCRCRYLIDNLLFAGNVKWSQGFWMDYVCWGFWDEWLKWKCINLEILWSSWASMMHIKFVKTGE